MNNTPTKSRPSLWLGKVLSVVLLLCIFICASSLYVVILLPSILALESIETTIEHNSKTILNIPLEIDDIACNWSDGLQISGLRIQESDDPKSILHIGEVAFNISVSEIFHGRVDIHLSINGFAFNFVRDADGKTNIDSLIASQSNKPPLPQPEVTKPETSETEGRSFSLPLDIGIKIELRDITVSVNDQVTDKHLLIDNGFFILDMPSIRYKETDLKLYMDLAVNNQKLPPVDVYLTASNLIDPATAAVSPEKIEIFLEGKLPGTKLSIDGNLFGHGLRSDVYIDLKELHAAVSPFLPAPVAASRVEGLLAVSTMVHMDSKDAASFESSVQLDRINVSGPVIQDRQINDFSARLLNTGKIDLPGKQLDIASGKLQLLQKSELAYHGVLKNADPAGQTSFFSLDTVSINIDELLKFGLPFLPPNLPVQLGGANQTSVLEITGAVLQGDFLTGDCIGKIERLQLNLPDLRVKDQNLNIRVKDTRFDLFQLTADLKHYFPVDIRFDSSLNMGSVAVETKETILVQNLSVPKFQFQVADIQKNPNALLGYAATLSGNQNLTIQKIRIPSLIELTSIRQNVDASCRLLPEKKILVGIREINLAVSDLLLRNDVVGSFQTNMDINGSLSELRINSLQPVALDISEFQNQINIGDFFELHMMTDIRDMAEQAALTKGDLLINLGNLFARLSKKPKQVSSLDGTVLLRWDVNTRRPSPSEITVLQKKSFTDLTKDFPFIHRIRTDLTLNHINADITINPELGFALEDISAEPLFQYDYDGKKGKGTYAGNLSLRDIKSTSIPAVRQSIVTKFSFSGAHDSLEKITLSQDFEIVSMGVKQSMDLTLSGLDRSVWQNKEKNIPYFLKNTGGSFSGQIAVTDMSIISQLQKDISAEGSLEAGLNLLLVPGLRVGGSTWIQLRDVVVTKDQQFSVRDLAGNIHLEKEYLLTGNMASRRTERDDYTRSHLSDRVLVQSDIQEKTMPVGYPGAEGRYPLQTDYPYPEMMIRFASAGSAKGPLPITLQHFQTGLELVEGLPRIHGLQVDLLGGTIVSSVSIQQVDKQFFVPITVSFTGVQTDRFWGKTVEIDQKKDTEVSGQVYAYCPITTNMDDFLNDLKVDMLFTHIGNMALEQLLYALDPTESNEKIVSQRKLVQRGSPKWMRLNIVDGALSLEGVVTVQGVDIDIPQVKRLNISGLPGLDPLERGLLKVAPVIKILRSMSANAIWMDQEKNAIRFIQ